MRRDHITEPFFGRISSRFVAVIAPEVSVPIAPEAFFHSPAIVTPARTRWNKHCDSSLSPPHRAWLPMGLGREAREEYYIHVEIIASLSRAGRSSPRDAPQLAHLIMMMQPSWNRRRPNYEPCPASTEPLCFCCEDLI